MSFRSLFRWERGKSFLERKSSLSLSSLSSLSCRFESQSSFASVKFPPLNIEADEEEQSTQEDSKLSFSLEELRWLKQNRPSYYLKRRLGTVVLPNELVERMSSILKETRKRELKIAGSELSEQLRKRTRVKNPKNTSSAMKSLSKEKTINYTDELAAAYVAHRMPAVFSCTYRLFEEIRMSNANFKPITMLDFGSGPGTTIWAAQQSFGTLNSAMAIERASSMIDLAVPLTRGVAKVGWRRSLEGVADSTYDLVIASYSLSELQTDEEREKIATSLWHKVSDGGVLAIVEPGTPVGFEVIKTVRSKIILEGKKETREEKKSFLLGPCTHSYECPLSKGRFCHFPQRMQRCQWQLSAKEKATRNYEDEKFSFIAFQKGPLSEEKNLDELGFARVISQPKKRGGHTILQLCGTSNTLESGKERKKRERLEEKGEREREEELSGDGRIVTKTVVKSSGKSRFRDSRKTKWGDLFRFQNYEID